MPQFEKCQSVNQEEDARASEPVQGYRAVPVDAKVAFAFHLVNLTNDLLSSNVDRITPETKLREPIGGKEKGETERHSKWLMRNLARTQDEPNSVNPDYIRWHADRQMLDGRITQQQYLQFVKEYRQHKQGPSYKSLEEHPIYSLYEQEYGASRFDSEQ